MGGLFLKTQPRKLSKNIVLMKRGSAVLIYASITPASAMRLIIGSENEAANVELAISMYPLHFFSLRKTGSQMNVIPYFFSANLISLFSYSIGLLYLITGVASFL
jgi:hypothetical protein